LPKTTETESNSIRAKIDIALRLCKTLLNYGYIDYNTFVNQLNTDNYFEEVIKKSLCEAEELLSQKTIPTLSLLLSISSAIKNSNFILNSSGAIIVD